PRPPSGPSQPAQPSQPQDDPSRRPSVDRSVSRIGVTNQPNIPDDVLSVQEGEGDSLVSSVEGADGASGDDRMLERLDENVQQLRFAHCRGLISDIRETRNRVFIVTWCQLLKVQKLRLGEDQRPVLERHEDGLEELNFHTCGIIDSTELMPQPHFNSDRCGLHNKPKLVIIQACRGSMKDKGHIFDQKIIHSLQEENYSDTMDLEKRVSYPGGHELRGSWFIQTIAKTFAAYAHEEHVFDMLTTVNRDRDGNVRREAGIRLHAASHQQAEEEVLLLSKVEFFEQLSIER
uniref:CASPASE_P20 domain-containing protein n=1 Tax=Macrostomum lignano TaxID=282301 RepID=A0A1I8F1E3_9PLAT